MKHFAVVNSLSSHSNKFHLTMNAHPLASASLLGQKTLKPFGSKQAIRGHSYITLYKFGLSWNPPSLRIYALF